MSGERDDDENRWTPYVGEMQHPGVDVQGSSPKARTIGEVATAITVMTSRPPSPQTFQTHTCIADGDAVRR